MISGLSLALSRSPWSKSLSSGRLSLMTLRAPALLPFTSSM